MTKHSVKYISVWNEGYKVETDAIIDLETGNRDDMRGDIHCSAAIVALVQA